VTPQHRYRPRGSCEELFRYRGDEVLLSGPAGTGKSRACLEKLNALALANPGMRGLIVRKTLASLGSTALETWRRYVIPEALAAGEVDFYGGSPEEPPQYRYRRNGSRIIIGGLDRPTRIMSSEYDVIYVQEAIELHETDWESLTTRLRNGVISFQQLMGDTNPDIPTHWLKLRCDAGRTRLIDCRHEDNPTLFHPDGTLTVPGGAYIGKLDNLTGVRYQRLRRGLWVSAEGIIYEDWDPAVHLVDWFEPPDNWTRWWSIDFGYTNPFVCQFWAEDPDGRLYLYREIYRTQGLVEEHAATILSCVRKPAPKTEGRTADPKVHSDWVWTEPRPRAIICDHDAEGRATLERHLGIATVAAQKTVSAGIQAVAARLRPAGDGKPRICFMRNALVERDLALAEAKKPTCTVEEVPGYIWDTRPGKPPKETPVKEDDHGMDTTRYMVAERDLGGRPTIRFITY
jgi:hypothetical protein